MHTWLVTEALLSKMKEFWRSQAVTFTSKMTVSWKRS